MIIATVHFIHRRWEDALFVLLTISFTSNTFKPHEHNKSCLMYYLFVILPSSCIPMKSRNAPLLRFCHFTCIYNCTHLLSWTLQKRNSIKVWPNCFPTWVEFLQNISFKKYHLIKQLFSPTSASDRSRQLIKQQGTNRHKCALWNYFILRWHVYDTQSCDPTHHTCVLHPQKSINASCRGVHLSFKNHHPQWSWQSSGDTTWLATTDPWTFWEHLRTSENTWEHQEIIWDNLMFIWDQVVMDWGTGWDGMVVVVR